MTYKYARGGIGDFLQCIESAIEEEVIDIYAHFKNAPSFFAPFDVLLNRVEYFETWEQLHSIHIPGQPLDRKFYPAFEVPTPPLERPKKIKILGIHVEGSDFSNQIWSQRGLPTKNMSREFMVSLFSELSKWREELLIYLFCSPDKAASIEEIFHKNTSNDFKVISYPFIWDSLSCVSHCDCVLGMDSSIKTMASILRIPTVVLVGDYVDEYRDSQFLNQYVSDGYMQVVKFKDINNMQPAQLFDLIKI